MLEVADIFRRYGEAYLEMYGEKLPSRHRRAFQDILHCRTPALGGYLYAGVPLPVWLSRVNPFGSDRFPAPFTLSLSLFLIHIISYPCLRAEHLLKKLLPQDC